MTVIDNLEKLLAGGNDSAMLRLGLGNAYLQAEDPVRAVEHIKQALRQQPDYSAAWKLLGRALAAADRRDEAQWAYTEGIAVAERRGDIQAAKEMRVFLKRLGKALSDDRPGGGHGNAGP